LITLISNIHSVKNELKNKSCSKSVIAIQSASTERKTKLI
jgi:hypothetical protein